ncbi:MAG TPA: hypothetical protein VFR14_12860 [Candidatus Limnocylindrales bacterium]|nr:hypothetical protein [Candidatus Limnocylindrales bacterium]
MTTDRDVGRLLDRWLADGLDQVNDHVLDLVEERIGLERQLPAWRASWRDSHVNANLKLAVGLAAVLIVAVVGWNLLPGRSPGVGGPPTTASPAPSPSATPSPVPTRTPLPCDSVPLCAGQLTPGDHQSSEFSPQVSYTVTDSDWTNTVDHEEVYVVDSPRGYLLLVAHPAIAERTAACEETPAAGYGDAPSDWIDFVTSHPGLDATNIHAVEIGGHTGQSADLASLTSWESPCAADDFMSNIVQFIVSSRPSPLGIYGVALEVPIRLIALDVDGQTVLITFYANDGLGLFDTSVVRAQAVIDSMRFCPAGGTCPP